MRSGPSYVRASPLSRVLMPVLLLALAALLTGCAATAPDAAPGAGAGASAVTDTTAIASVWVIGRPEGGSSVMVSFRTPRPILIASGRPLRVVTPTGTFEAAYASGPDVAVQQGVSVTSAEYRLGAAETEALERAGEGARIGIDDGSAVRTYAIRRGDFTQ